MKSVTIGELALALDARSWGDQSLLVTGAAEPDSTEPVGPEGGLVAMAMSPKYAGALKPGCMAILADGMDPEAYGLKAAIFAPRPRLLMAGLTRAFDPGLDVAPGIHPSAVVDSTAEIAEDVAIGPLVVIGANVRIGRGSQIASHVSIGRDSVLGQDCVIHPGARIAHGVRAGDRLIMQPGSSIGGDGFSFVTPEESGIEEIRRTLGARDDINAQHWTRIHSLGGVEIGDDVELGANSTIDRGTIRATRVGSGTKIDNLVQIGHNVEIGADCLLCGLVGVAGSSRIGDRVVLAGQVGVSDNIVIGDDVIAGGATKIFSRVPAGRVILGHPAVKMETQMEIQKAMRRLPRFAQQLSQLQETVTRLLEKG